MSIILTALDSSPAARPALETGLRIAELTGTRVEAVHVADSASEIPAELASRAGVPLRRLDGPLQRALSDAIASPDVLAAVLGARATPHGRRPVGRTAAHILEHADKPIVVVPPEAIAPLPFRRVLLPLEGTTDSSTSVLQHLSPLIKAAVEIIVLHVFTDATLPAMLDRPYRDLEMLGKEFLAQHFPQGTRIELRSGPVAARIGDLVAEAGVDLIVLSWSQDSSPGHAQVIREVLGATGLPVLVIPTATAELDHPTQFIARLEQAHAEETKDPSDSPAARAPCK
jgi:nucleotide-binding universal stress UspA family protein